MNPPDILSRATGCLLGLAVGDALGAPLEFMTGHQIQIKHGTVRDMIGGGWLGLRPGETTEDTALMVRLARSLVEKGEFMREDVALRYAEWYRRGQKSPSGVLRTALALLAEGVPPGDVARRAHGLSAEEPAGNATLARCVPIALRYGPDDRRVIEAAALEAGITHVDARAVGGSAALALTLSLLIEGLEPGPALDRAHEILESDGLGVGNFLPDPRASRAERLRPTTNVLDTLETAYHHFYRARGFGACLVDVVNLGGDADTIGAVAGALAGARFGAEAIPPRWLRPLAERDLLRDLARDLVAGRRESRQE